MTNIVKHFVLGSALLLPIGNANATDASDIRLVVQITIDGFRGDLLNRYEPNFGPNGFRRMTENGVWYTDAHHMHANTETIVGHATLATGAHPSEHGMFGNSWFNRADGRLGYNIEDPNFELLPVPGFDGEGEQLDPTQTLAETSGRSPANLLATTFGDELFKSNNGRSKIIGISGKDRSAVAMAGHVGKAFWMSVETGAFESSTYYYDAYPDWAIDWNSERPADVAIGTEWSLNDPIDTYLLAENDDRPYETDLKGFGRTFPHSYGSPADGLYYSQALVSPLGDKLTASFGKAAVLGEELGKDEAVDYISLSFSGVDATNHFFGPSSLENEEMVRMLDRTLADLFTFLDEEVGQDHLLLVLSADHGMPEMPEYMAAQGHASERNGHTALADELNGEIKASFGVDGTIKAFFRPYIYLDHEVIEAAGVDQREIERLIVDSLAARPGISMAMPSVPFPEQRDSFLEGPIRRNFHPSRSGDIYVVQSPYSFLLDPGAVAAMHGSPWRYDTHVPILFEGPGIEPARISRRVGTIDVAVTLSNFFGTTMPSGASGSVLSEVFR
ncbi:MULTISPECIES: alkaline phosphatase family protein [Falsihalocynthiibacter]|uniref:alkaline phosphatase family protein n=1 Tax=Falsihalocynthiibacter TaxID=2854182 RepID=UPI003003609F